MRPLEPQLMLLLVGWAQSIVVRVDLQSEVDLEELVQSEVDLEELVRPFRTAALRQAAENCRNIRSSLERYLQVYPDQGRWLTTLAAEVVPDMVGDAPAADSATFKTYWGSLK